MIFNRTKIDGVYIVELEKFEDNRGFFARAWCREEFEKQGLNPNLVQCNFAFNKKKGTLRGMHFQGKPFEEAKFIRCSKGSIFDVAVDVRPDSPTFKQYVSVNLTATNYYGFYIPEGCAHGYQALEDNSELFYQMSCAHAPDHAKVFRWNDPVVGIDWPIKEPIILPRDNEYPDLLSIF